MTTKMSGASTYAVAQRTYADLAGVDFCNIPSQVALNRSPDALNIYKNYLSTNGQAIETRPGITNLGATGSTVYGLHILDTKCLIHHGTHLSKWDTFPSAIEDSGDLTLLRTSMSEETSTSFVFGDKLYISDGVNYLVYDGTTLSNVKTNATIPTTRIAADPDGGERGAVSRDQPAQSLQRQLVYRGRLFTILLSGRNGIGRQRNIYDASMDQRFAYDRGQRLYSESHDGGGDILERTVFSIHNGNGQCSDPLQ